MDNPPPEYLDLHKIVQLINSPNKNPIIGAYVEYAELFAIAPGSRKKHQSWSGGYLDYVVYSTNIALKKNDSDIEIGYKYDDVGDIPLIMLLKNIGRVKKYEKTNEGWKYVIEAIQKEYQFFDQIVQSFGFYLKENHENALEFFHGEGIKSKQMGTRAMKHLAALCNIANTHTTRIAYDRPFPRGTDNWPGAYRHSEKENLVKYIQQLEQFKE